MRIGYSSGTCAAAAAHAAVHTLIRQEQPETVVVALPGGEQAQLSVYHCQVMADRVTCSVIKDSGDDPDSTNGCEIVATARWSCQSEQLTILGGEGVGIVTKPGLKVPVGKHAINPVPLQMIRDNVLALLDEGQSVEVTISVPDGAQLAARTLNPKLGIVGGISILGTSGRVYPMSNAAYKTSLLTQLDVAQSQGFTDMVFVPGGASERVITESFAVPGDAIAQMSNWVGYMLQQMPARGFRRVVLAGHVGKLCKVAGGIFDTHSKVADARMEILAAYAAAAGATTTVVVEVLRQTTTESAMVILRQHGLDAVLDRIAERVSQRAAAHVAHALQVGCILYDLSENIVAFDANALTIGRRNAWWNNLS